MLGKSLVVLGLVGLALLLFGKGLELASQYWPVAAIALALWLIWRIWQDKRGRYTRKSPEKFRRDYRIIRDRRMK